MLKDLALVDCCFEACHIPRLPTMANRVSVQNIVIRDAIHVNCSVDGATLEEVSLCNLKRHGSAPLFMWDCAFRHVTLEGRISALKINRCPGPRASLEDQAASDRYVKDFYATTDWALDISKANFAGGVTFEALPGDKIRRDPNTQVLASREALTAKNWRGLDYNGTAIDIALSWFLSGSIFDSVVLAARTGSKEAKKDVAVLEMLRRNGIAE